MVHSKDTGAVSDLVQAFHSDKAGYLPLLEDLDDLLGAVGHS
jgi:hypothetical protein